MQTSGSSKKQVLILRRDEPSIRGGLRLPTNANRVKVARSSSLTKPTLCQKGPYPTFSRLQTPSSFPVPAPTQTMTSIAFETLMPVVDSWELLKRKEPEWQETFGRRLMEKVFQKAPLSLTLLFSFGTEGDKMYSTSAFQETCDESASVLDFVITSLGADMDIVKMQLMEIAEQHKGFENIRPEHWIILGKALIEALEETLGDKFEASTKSCWASAFDSVSTMMMEEMGSR